MRKSRMDSIRGAGRATSALRRRLAGLSGPRGVAIGAGVLALYLVLSSFSAEWWPARGQAGASGFSLPRSWSSGSSAAAPILNFSSDTLFCDPSQLAETLESKVLMGLQGDLPRDCVIQKSDRVLVNQCRAWQGAFRARTRGAQQLPQNGALLRSLQRQCPPLPAADKDDAEFQARVAKYDQRMQTHQCEAPSGMWRENHLGVHKCVVVNLITEMRLRPRDLVLDWGCGCGHKLTMLKQLHDVDGMGIDLTQGAIRWAQDHAYGEFCRMDGRKLAWIPDNTFHGVLSFAALYHLPLPDQCATLREMVRITKPGGTIFIGWMGANHEIPVDHWYSVCAPMLGPGAHLDVYPELHWLVNALVQPPEFKILGEYGKYAFNGVNSSYALFVRVLEPAVPADADDHHAQA